MHALQAAICYELEAVTTLNELGADFPSEEREFTAMRMLFRTAIGTPMPFQC